MKILSILIPVFNEVGTIEAVLARVFKEKLPGWEKEVIVIDDGSTDGTKAVLSRWGKKCHILSLAENQGKGVAIKEGLNHIHGDIILIQDADLEYDPHDYQKLLEPFQSARVNVVFGSRFLGSHLSTMFLYAIGNKFVTFLTNILYNTNITDMETGYKAFRREVIQGMNFEAKRFDFEPEFTAKILKAGHQIYEVPISYYGRKFSEGKKLTWRDGIVAVSTLIKWKWFQ